MPIPSELLDNDLLFHFTKPHIAMEHILYDKKIRFSSLTNMNDPYEYKMPSVGVPARHKINQQTASKLLNMLKDTILNKSKILSLVRNKKLITADNYQLSFTKPRLWAQYAEAQYGICLCFSLKAFIDKFKNEYPEFTIYHGPVKYNLQKVGKSFKNKLDYQESLSHDENIQAHLRAHRNDIFFRKYKDFRDENEYRIVLINWSDPRNSDIFIDLQGILKGVILGERFHRAYLEMIKSLVYNLDAILYRIGYGAEILIQKY